MKLKSQFIIYEFEGEQYLTATDGSFPGMIKNNSTAAFITNLLKEETTEAEIVDKMCEAYNAPREVIEQDVHNIIESFRKIGAIEE